MAKIGDHVLYHLASSLLNVAGRQADKNSMYFLRFGTWNLLTIWLFKRYIQLW